MEIKLEKRLLKSKAWESVFEHEHILEVKCCIGGVQSNVYEIVCESKSFIFKVAEMISSH